MNNSELYYFAGRCLSLDENPDFRFEIIEKSQTDALDWIRFVTLCSNHLVLPSVYLKFKSHRIIKYLPKELTNHLEKIYELNLSRNQAILVQIQKITTALNLKNISPIFLKGSGNLLDNLYLNIGERILGDIDFLVPESEYLKSAKILKTEGYEEINPNPEYIDISSLKHYPRMCHPDFPAVIEIHRIPVKDKYLDEMNIVKINSEMYPAPNVSGCYILSDKHKIVLNFIHCLFGSEDNAYKIISLRDIYDLHLLSKRISIQEVLPNIRRKTDAEIYFAYERKVLDLPKNGLTYKKLRFKIFSQKQMQLLNSRIFYQGYRMIYFLFQMILSHYILKFLQLFYSRNVRQEVIKKVKRFTWYKNHVQWYARFMQSNK